MGWVSYFAVFHNGYLDITREISQIEARKSKFDPLGSLTVQEKKFFSAKVEPRGTVDKCVIKR